MKLMPHAIACRCSFIAGRRDAPARRRRHRSIERQRTRSPPIDEMNIRNARSSTGLMSAAPPAGARDRSPRTALAHARGPSTTKWQGEEEAGVAARPRHARGGIGYRRAAPAARQAPLPAPRTKAQNCGEWVSIIC
ncbi:hypothetical protein KDX01_03410 [Burkholderia vietnamiensis]|uniref:hypothetical protein n=1 Tax=Burkholderia vietnamiensis TaxID=60552 RepID=UPI001B8FFB69|nr:hypothetical protein [Burkholderia vietnamiensis]MBR7972167.1 hypothetical protein [Burkholderia vietnamiensis]